MKRCLIISGGYEPHRANETAGRLDDMLREDFDVVHSPRLDAYLTEDLASYDLIVPNWTLGEMSLEMSRNLRLAVESGVGLGGFHGGMADGFRHSTHFRFIVGGTYAAEPGGICDYEVKVEDPQDPIMSGLADFSYRSEQYYMHVDPAVTVLATTRFSGSPYPWLEGVVMPTVWKKMFGKGRVFFSALGHVPEEFDRAPMHTLLARGLRWASRAPLHTAGINKSI